MLITCACSPGHHHARDRAGARSEEQPPPGINPPRLSRPSEALSSSFKESPLTGHCIPAAGRSSVNGSPSQAHAQQRQPHARQQRQAPAQQQRQPRAMMRRACSHGLCAALWRDPQ
ncbi:MAG: hypothetical protein WDW38_007813 [Sanguina aurantia]